MNVTPLSHIHPGVYNYTIYVRISRMWEFHGKNDDEAIKHLDLVLIDQKVHPIFINLPTFTNFYLYKIYIIINITVLYI